jgi:DNA-binding MarR family transcriptional regulator
MADKTNAARVVRDDRAAGRRGVAATKPSAAASKSELSATRLDRLIHERTRLAIVSALAANPSLSFTELKQLLRASDGNLSVHARKLEDAGYIACTKSFSDRIPRTEYRLTASGRRALERYLDHMEALIRATREA